MSKVKVDINEVGRVKDYLAGINQLDLECLRLFDGDWEISVSPECIKEFKYSGLSNVDFIQNKCYRPPRIVLETELCPLDDAVDPCSQECLECEWNMYGQVDPTGRIIKVHCLYGEENYV